MLVSEELEKTPLHTNFASLDLWSSMAALIAGSVDEGGWSVDSFTVEVDVTRLPSL